MAKDKATDVAAQAEAGSASALSVVCQVLMTQDKVTKNSIRYAEVHESDTEADKIGQLYVQKATFAPKAAPKSIYVTVEIAEQ